MSKNMNNQQKTTMMQKGVCALAKQIRDGQLSPVEAVQEALRVIEERDKDINAFTAVSADAALELARQREQQAVNGQWQGPLHGVPVAVKDLIHIKGMANTRGSRLYEQAISSETAPVAQRLIDAGAIVVGKTTTTEFGWKAASTCPLHGVTRNPLDLSLTSGGSSSGSAAALAAGMVAATLGSDGGGSVRIPASFCGIFSMKGTLGRIPAWPWSATEMLSHVGPMTHNVADSALLFDLLKGPHWRDPQSLSDDGVSYPVRCQKPLPARLRIRYAPSLFDVAVDPEVAAVVDQAVRRLSSNMDVDVDDSPLDWVDPFAAFEALWCIGRGTVYGGALGDSISKVDPGFARLIEWSRTKTAKDYLSALEQRALFAQSVGRSFEDFELLITPAVPILPFAADDDGPAHWDPLSSPVAWARWTPFSYPFNLTGQPAASLPCGYSQSGLPVGLQVVGPRHRDALVLHFCSIAERILEVSPPQWNHPSNR